MTCADARDLVLAHARGALPPGDDAAVREHLASCAACARVLLSQRPMDVESSDVHQVKPWFAGRLDFAPAVAFDGDAEFPLRGGAVGYFLDRRAAVFLYSRRLHTISLFVVRADGLDWPERRLEMSSRGFRVILWRAGAVGLSPASHRHIGAVPTARAKVMGEPA